MSGATHPWGAVCVVGLAAILGSWAGLGDWYAVSGVLTGFMLGLSLAASRRVTS